MSGFVDGVHQRVQIVAPIVQQLVWCFRLLERHNAGQTVDFAADCLVRYQIRQELFGLLFAKIEQVGHSLRVDSRVVLGHYSHVLNQQ